MRWSVGAGASLLGLLLSGAPMTRSIEPLTISEGLVSKDECPLGAQMRLVGGPERCDDYFKAFPLAATPQEQQGEIGYGVIPQGIIYSVIERDAVGEVQREWFTVACRGSDVGFSQMVYDGPSAAFYTSSQGKYIEQKIETSPRVRELARGLLLRELSRTCVGQMQWASPPRQRQA